MNILLITLAILPGLVISFLIIRADRFEKESKWLMVVAFLLGALITYPTMKAEAWAATSGWEESGNFFKLFFFSIVFVGLIEEFFKFICLIVGPYLSKEFNEPLDGIVYCVLIAMGFATLENIIYADRFGMQTTALRAFTAVPAHGAFAVMMGYFAGLAKLDKNQQVKLLLTGLVLATVVHGIYDFFILQPYAEWLMSLATLVLVVSIYFAYKMILKHQQDSPFHPDKQAPPPPEEPAEEPVPEAYADNNEIMNAVIEDMKSEEE